MIDDFGQVGYVNISVSIQIGFARTAERLETNVKMVDDRSQVGDIHSLSRITVDIPHLSITATGIAQPIVVGILLARISNSGAIVTHITKQVAISIELIGIRDSRTVITRVTSTVAVCV